MFAYLWHTVASTRSSPDLSVSAEASPFAFNCFLRSSTKSVFARCWVSSLAVDVCATALCEKRQLSFLWLQVTTKCNSMPQLFWQSHPCHKERRSREPPWTGLLHKRTKITGLRITYRSVGTGAIARSQYKLEDFSSQCTGLDKEFPSKTMCRKT